MCRAGMTMPGVTGRKAVPLFRCSMFSYGIRWFALTSRCLWQSTQSQHGRPRVTAL